MLYNFLGHAMGVKGGVCNMQPGMFHAPLVPVTWDETGARHVLVSPNSFEEKSIGQMAN